MDLENIIEKNPLPHKSLVETAIKNFQDLRSLLRGGIILAVPGGVTPNFRWSFLDNVRHPFSQLIYTNQAYV